MKGCNFGLAGLNGSGPRFFPTVAAWCAALCELADISTDEDALDLWQDNLTTHTKMMQAFKGDLEQAHLKAAADHFVAIHTHAKGIVP